MRKDRQMLTCLHNLARDEQGQDLIEYTLLLAFVLFLIVGLTGGFHSSIAGVAAVSDSQVAAANLAAPS